MYRNLLLHLIRFGFRAERRAYYGKCLKAEVSPKKYLSLIIDGMDQSKTNLPHPTCLSKVIFKKKKITIYFKHNLRDWWFQVHFSISFSRTKHTTFFAHTSLELFLMDMDGFLHLLTSWGGRMIQIWHWMFFSRYLWSFLRYFDTPTNIHVNVSCHEFYANSGTLS